LGALGADGGGGGGGGAGPARAGSLLGAEGGGGALPASDSDTVDMIKSRVSLSLRSLFLTPAAWNSLRHSGGMLRIYARRLEVMSTALYTSRVVSHSSAPRIQHRRPSRCGSRDGSREAH